MEKYAEEIRTIIAKKMPEKEVRVVKVYKTNDTELIGVCISDECKGPQFYVEGYHKKGLSPKQAADEIMHMYAMEAHTVDNLDVIYDDLKNNLTFRLVETARNEKYMKDKVHIDIANGLSVLFVLQNGEYSSTITKSILEDFSENVTDLLDKTLSNAQKTDKPILKEMMAAMSLMFGIEDENLLETGRHPEDFPLVLTSKSGYFGANAILIPGVMEKIYEIVGDEYYLLPSSIHEWIIVEKNMDIRDLQKMVKEANKTVVEPEEVLSDDVFKYDGIGIVRVEA